MLNSKNIYGFNELGLADISRVGGKNASLGELINTLAHTGIRIPPGFATSAQMFRDYLLDNGLVDRIESVLSDFRNGHKSLADTGNTIRSLIMAGKISDSAIEELSAAYQDLGQLCRLQNLGVAVRSSATAEDLPEASFAGQQESYLNISGIASLLEAFKKCYASLYTDRAIVYRMEQGFADTDIAISVGIQQMVRADIAGAGVMFTIDTENGFPDTILISAAWGLGETVVKGAVIPDRIVVYKPFLANPSLRPIIENRLGSKLEKMIYGRGDGNQEATITLSTSLEEQQRPVLSDQEILQLARWGMLIEDQYKRPMDIEWAKDGQSGELFIVQARPETIESQKNKDILTNYKLTRKSEVLLTGASVGRAISSGQAYYLSDPTKHHEFPAGAILITERTDPDWVPVMRIAAGIITNTGGPTSHAAIVSRELKVPAIVGSVNATQLIQNGQEITLCCSEGVVGKVYAGLLPYTTEHFKVSDFPETNTDLMINAALPEAAMGWWQLPVAGIGLTRIEFIISSQIKAHPMALLHMERVNDPAVRSQLEELARGYSPRTEYFVDRLAQGIATIAASRYPQPVIVRTSDFKSNEYRGLVGGEYFEIHEENPMLGLRGASRYYNPLYSEAFQLECAAIKRVREVMGFTNVIVMIPFCRTPAEADLVLAAMSAAGLERGVNELQVYVMCEIPSNVILAAQFCQRFDGFSIGSNDLTQLVLGVDRDSEILHSLFDATDEAVKSMIKQVIQVAHQHGCKVGICGQAPSDHPEFAEFLVDSGIDSISLNPDSVLAVSQNIAAFECLAAGK
ncbi:MAG: phosphoenolpyruvate synthase [Pseudomonadales bacterium]|nr:phosphoenolpyruvate synthase [Pseudomonadales bacterium]